jgi:TP901 family phage tail tape measure protein
MRYHDKVSQPLGNAIGKVKTHNREMQALGKRVQKTGDGMQKIGKGLTAGVTLPIAGIGAASVKTAMDFESQMSRVGAIAGVTGKGLEPLSAQARELGANTVFGASEAAAGMENLASAGFGVNEIIGAMPGLLNLAAVSGGDIAASAEQAAGAYRAFGMTNASEMTHIADVFARAAADTNAEAADMGEALNYVAPVAHGLGISMEETAAAIGVMSDANIKGSQAGTTLRGALSRLTKPSKAMTEVMKEYGLSFYDAEGNMLPLQDQLGMMKEKFAGLTQEQKAHAMTTLFGQNSVSGMLALVDRGPEAFGKLTKSLENSDGASAKMAEEMNDNLAGKVKSMKSAMESAAITIGTALAPNIGRLTDKIRDAAKWFDNLSPKQQQMIIKAAGIAAAVGPVVLIIGKLTSGVGKALQTFPKAAKAFSAMGRAMMANPIIAIVGVIAMLVLGLMHLYKTNKKVRDAFDKAWRDIQKAFKPVMDELKPIIPYLKKFGKFLQNTILPIVGKVAGFIVKYAIKGIIIAIKGISKAVQFVAGVITVAIVVIKGVISGVIDAFGVVKTFITETVPGFFLTAVEKVKGFWIGVGDFFKGTFETIVGTFTGIGTKVGETIASAFKAVVNGILGGVEFILNAPIIDINAALGLINKIPGVNIPLIPTLQLPRLAKGTMGWMGGPAVVGEKGGEIIDLPRGSRVYPHDKSVQMAKNGGGKVVNIKIMKLADRIEVREDADIDRIADKLAEKIVDISDQVAA